MVSTVHAQKEECTFLNSQVLFEAWREREEVAAKYTHHSEQSQSNRRMMSTCITLCEKKKKKKVCSTQIESEQLIKRFINNY